MKNENDKSTSNSEVCRFLSIGVVVILALSTRRAEAASEFHPSLLLGTTWTDNITLAGDNDPLKESGFVTQVNPGFKFAQKAKRFSSSFEYTMQNVFFQSNSDRNATYHQGEAGFITELIDSYVYLDGAGSYTQQLLDPKLPTNNGNLFLIANQTDALAAHLSPSIRHEFEAFRFDARYTRGLIDYKNETGPAQLRDADTQSYSGLIGSADDLSRLTWEAQYQKQEAKYEQLPTYVFEQAHAELGWLFGKVLRVIGRSGAESDMSQDPTKGGLDYKTWEGGFKWAASERTRIEAFIGDHFYGRSYSALAHHEAHYARWDLSYSEAPLTQAQESILHPIASDLAQLGRVEPGSVEFNRATAAVYLRKTFEARLHIEGQRTGIDLFATDYRREYLNGVIGNEHLKGGSIELTRHFSGQTEFHVSGKLEDSDLVEGVGYREVDFSMELRRRLGENVHTSLRASRIDRTGSADYTANLITATIAGEY
jgi:hypothetical protein